MTIRKYFYALPAMAALLLTASCSNQENEMIEAPQPAKTRIIPYTVQVNDNSDTRLTLNEDKKYTFEDGDKLYIWGSGGEGEDAWTVGGELDWEKDYSFSGSVAVTGEPSDVSVNVIVKGKNDQLLPATFKEFAEGGYKTDEIVPANAIAADAKEAVGKYSLIKGDGKFSNKLFIVSQNSSFIEFDITLEDGTLEGEELDVSIKSGGEDIRSGASVTTLNVDGDIKAKFVIPFETNSPLENASVKLGSKNPISFGGEETWLGPNYKHKVTRTYGSYQLTVSAYGQKITSSFKVLPHKYSKTIEEILAGLDCSNVEISGCEMTSGDDNISIEGDEGLHTLKAIAKGTSTYNVTGTAKISGFNILPLDVTFTVADAEK